MKRDQIARLNLVAMCLALALMSRAVPLIAAGAQEPTAPAPVAAPPGAPDQQAADQKPAKRSSPWLLVPVVSSSPKLGTSFGGMGAYLKTFDADSQVSMFGATFQYTTTDSTVAAAFARTSSGADHHRVIAMVIFGYIKNDYDDYLGTGQPLKTNDDLQASRARIVASGDAERRKLERNLHDGAQQHLVSLAVNLRLAKENFFTIL